MRHELPESIAEAAEQPYSPPWPPQAPDAVFFGTFNPITQGHTHLLEAAHMANGFKSIWVIPAFGSPFKHTHPAMAAYTDRLTMAQLACQRYPWAIVSPVESWITEHGQPCYSSGVISALVEHYTDLPSPLPFIMGMDALSALPQWEHPDMLVKHCEFWVAPRPDQSDTQHELRLAAEALPGIRLQALTMEPTPTSSSRIRSAIQSTQHDLSWEALDLHPAVWGYIQENHLYGLS